MKNLLVSLLAAAVFFPGVSYGLIGGGGVSGGGGASGGFSLGGVVKFGGKIMFRQECTCSPGISIIYIKPSGGSLSQVTLTISPFTRMYSNRKPFTGSWILGEYLSTGGSSGECYMWAGATCVQVNSQGSIKRIGTS